MLIAAPARAEMVAEFVLPATEPRRRSRALEAAHGLVTAFQAAVVLLRLASTGVVLWRAGHPINFADLVAAAIPDRAHGKPIEVWCQDEARVGQQGSLTYVWHGLDGPALCGTTPERRADRVASRMATSANGRLLGPVPLVNADKRRVLADADTISPPSPTASRCSHHQAIRWIRMLGYVAVIQFAREPPEQSTREALWQLPVDQAKATLAGTRLTGLLKWITSATPPQVALATHVDPSTAVSAAPAP